MQAPTNGNVVKDLLSLDDDDTPKASTAGPSSFAEDLLGGLGADSNGHAAGSAAGGSAAIDLLSLLDDSASAQQPTAAALGAPSQSALVHTSSSLRFPKEHVIICERGNVVVCDCSGWRLHTGMVPVRDPALLAFTSSSTSCMTCCLTDKTIGALTFMFRGPP